MEFKISQLQKIEQAISNKVFLEKSDFDLFASRSPKTQVLYGKILNGVFRVAHTDGMEKGAIGLSSKQREFLKVSHILDKVRLEPFALPTIEYRAGLLKVNISPVKLDKKKEVKSEDFARLFKQLYLDHFFAKDQEVYFDFEGFNFVGRVTGFDILETGVPRGVIPYAMLCPETEYEFTSIGSVNLHIKNNQSQGKNIFKQDFKFEDMGVGGLDAQIANIFRRAFSSRRIPNHILEKYGIKHIKGMILHGPPGTGKTLIARQLAKVLHAKEPKIVNGPELFNKYVGETEANVRSLFDDAKKDNATLKEDSPLHVIIFDEFDSIAKHRGSDASGTGVSDNIVNQLLSMIDGVESLDNILVIGMTNRLDLIDRAILRPGRFEVHVEIGLPNEEGRQQILKIHTKTMTANGLLGSDVSLKHLASLTVNFTGAEIEALVKSASSFGMNRHHNLMDFSKRLVIDKPGLIELQDFNLALSEIQPEYGIQSNKVLMVNDNIQYGSRQARIYKDLTHILDQVKTNNLPLASILLHGLPGTGLTCIASSVCFSSKIPLVKIVSPDDFIGKTENYKVNYLARSFEDAYKSNQSVILIDDLDRILEYIEVGKRFNNNLLGAFLVLLKKKPPKAENSLAILCTCSNVGFLKEFGIYNQFNVKIAVPELSFNFSGENEIGNVVSKFLGTKVSGTLGQSGNFKIGIKKLLFILSIIKKQSGQGSIEELFKEALQMSGYESRTFETNDFSDRIDSNFN